MVRTQPSQGWYTGSTPVRAATYGKQLRTISTQAGWRYGYISSTNQEGRQFWVVAAEREGAECFIAHDDEKLTAFLELELLHRAHGEVS